MIDFVPSEIFLFEDIKSVSDNNFYDITFNEAYPSMCPMALTFELNGHTYHYDLLITSSDYYNGVGVPGSLVEYGDPFEIIGTSIYAFCIRRYDDHTFSVDYINSTIGVCYYCLSPKQLISDPLFPFGGTYVRISKADVDNMKIQNPFGPNVFVGGKDIYWLYNFGQYINGLTSSFGDLLNFSIGKYNIVGLVVGSGFLLYCGWCLLKWTIPL